jgi:hypothetical protein
MKDLTLKQYIERLQEFANNNKEALDLPVVYATDELGSEYHKVSLKPSLMVKDDSVSYPNYIDIEDLPEDEKEASVVCIN